MTTTIKGEIRITIGGRHNAIFKTVILPPSKSKFLSEITQEGLLAAAAKLYADGADLKQPLISPVYGDFAGFPPTILFTGTRDLFLSGTVRTHRNMRASGVDAELNVFEAMSHGEWILQDLPESKVFTSEIAVFLKRHMK